MTSVADLHTPDQEPDQPIEFTEEEAQYMLSNIDKFTDAEVQQLTG